ncbi:aminotransferase class V-fold PLP-dependent enzyme [Flagellimonas alvinocaridis]|uniref:Aminotransferase class V-fold PLP-dependent enzyme n=1 Tax=Flagellimonas alvinocaridis TaxID=2530200 RepID=A0A4S8RRU3_9FLAO|nr:aminotransferase class V-fold PLP-dependent enzyme [Allomuricauda alvinocaridis]THV60970.1 aminotransferase class V-fold PLP-dependent enzyme [Allomuricauda alvinocaridis]
MKRRTLIRKLGVLPLTGAIAQLIPSSLYAGRQTETAKTLKGLAFEAEKGKNIYEKIGVRPVINGRGTITVIGGCRILPEVEQAMEEATHHYVEFDELMDGVGQRLAALTGTEYGVVTTGATGALIIATTGIVTGGDPDKLWQLPNLEGMKDEVIIPKYSWTAYESSVRGVGVKMITVDSKEELKAALGPRTAMVLVLAGSKSMNGPLSVKEIASVTKPLDVPILVDAAAEGLPVPNPHIGQGADLVAYSGGKYLGGPQCAGLLLGRKDLIKAAWVTSAPHHGFGRGYKVGREEIMGMLAAVEMWMKRDHVGERQVWTNRLEYIANKLNKIPGLETSIRQPPPEQLSNPSPSLRVKWDMEKIPLTGHEVEQILWNQTPRVAVSGAGSFLPFPPNTSPTIGINTSQLKDGEEKIIADRVFEVLSNPPKIEKNLAPASFNLSGEWEVTMWFAATSSDQTFVIVQKDKDIKGTHYGSYASRGLMGNIHGDEVLIRSSHTEDGVRLNFTFKGKVHNAQNMGGDVSFSEYGNGKWEAKRKY